jgi:hypothetical protein
MRLSLVMIEPSEVSALVSDFDSLQQLLLRRHRGPRLDMDKEWHGIHFLLNGNAWSTEGEYGQAVFGGQEVGPNLGYGPVRVLSAEDTSQLSSRLSAVSPETLRRRFDPVVMTSEMIYPEIWERDGNGALEWLLKGYGKLTDFYTQAAAGGKAVVLAVL